MRRLLISLALLLACRGIALAADPCVDSVGPNGYFCYTNTTTSPRTVTALAAGSFDFGSQFHWLHRDITNTSDCPAGCWQNYFDVNSPSNTQTGTFTLPSELPAGTYYIFFDGISYDSGGYVSLTCGSATSANTTWNDRDANDYWTVASGITIVTPCSDGTLNLFRPMGATDQNLLFLGLYITSDATVTVTTDGTAVDLTYPTVMDDSAAVAGNHIFNASFEAPADGAWGMYGNKYDILPNFWDSACDGGAHTGDACLKLPLDATSDLPNAGTDTQLISRIYHLKENKKYTFSAWVKLASGTKSVTIHAFNSFTPPAGYMAQPDYHTTITATTSWQRISLTEYMLGYPTADYYFDIRTDNASSSNYLYIDDAQLEEGTITTFAAATACDPIISTTKPGHIYFTNDTLTATLRIWNGTGSNASCVINYQIYDYLNRAVLAQRTVTTSVNAGVTSSASFDVSTGGLTGNFRILYWPTAVNGADKELVYAIIPPTTTSADATSYMGIHPNYTEANIGVSQRLGAKAVRDLSPGGICRWEFVQPSADTFLFDRDADLAIAVDHNMQPLCTLTANAPATNGLSSWAYSGGVPIIAKYAAFVTGVVAHYKTRGISYYEMWNEPISVMSANWYARLLIAGVNALEAECPTCHPVCIGGMNNAIIQSIFDQLAIVDPTWNILTHCPTISTHDYPEGVNPALLTPFVNDGYVVWNTETGSWDHGPYQGYNSNFVSWGTPITPYVTSAFYYESSEKSPVDVLTNLTRTIGSKQSKYFYQDIRIAAAPNYFDHHPTFLEYDEALRHKAVAYGIWGSLLDHATGAGDSSGDSDSSFFGFATSGDPIASMYSTDHNPRQVALSGSHGDYALYDLMGNAVSFSGTTIPYGRQPVYLKGVGLSAATLRSRLAAGTISDRADGTPPNIVIVDAPRTDIPSVTALAPLRIRWIALDDIYYPNFGELNSGESHVGDNPDPNAILYSWRLLGYTDYTAWIADTYVDFDALPDGVYTFEVRAKDGSDNESQSVQRVFTVGTPPVPGSSGGGRLRLRR